MIFIAKYKIGKNNNQRESQFNKGEIVKMNRIKSKKQLFLLILNQRVKVKYQIIFRFG